MINWRGERTVRRTTGQTRELCPIHRRIHPFDVVEIRRRGLASDRSANVDLHLGYELRSDDCPHIRPIDPASLVEAPEVRHRERLFFEERLRTAPDQVPIDIRRLLLRRAVTDVARVGRRTPTAEVELSPVRRELAVGAAVSTATIALGLTSGRTVVQVAGLFVAFVWLLCCLVLADVRTRRSHDAQFAAAALTAIAPLRLDLDDIAAAIAWARSNGFVEARHIDAVAVARPPRSWTEELDDYLGSMAYTVTAPSLPSSSSSNRDRSWAIVAKCP